MGLKARDIGGGDFKPVPPGSYVARCISVIDLGTQVSIGKFGEKAAHKVRLSWEVFGDDDDGQPLTINDMPMTISKEYTVSLHEKAALRRDLAAWRGRDFTDEERRGFDVDKLLGVYALINVTHDTSSNGKTYANVAGLAPVPKAMAAAKPPGVHPLTRFDLDAPDMEVFESLPEWLQKRIEAAPEWVHKPAGAAPVSANGAADLDDDVPFASSDVAFDLASRMSRRVRKVA
jgi:hypothetical protein